MRDHTGSASALHSFTSALPSGILTLEGACCLFTRDQIRNLSDTFRTLDKEGTGALSIAALNAGIKNSGLAPDLAHNMSEAFSQIAEGGRVEYTPFVAACLDKRTYLDHSNLLEAFHRFQVIPFLSLSLAVNQGRQVPSRPPKPHLLWA